MPYTLTVTSLPGRPEFVFDDTAVARLGRTADNDVVVRDPNASRAHCRLFVQDGKHWLEDLGSANGTTVNGDPIQGAVPVKSGDVIGIGEVVFAFAIRSSRSGPSTSAFDERDTVVPGGAKARTDLRETLVKTGLRAAVKRAPIPEPPSSTLVDSDEPAAEPARDVKAETLPLEPAPEAPTLSPKATVPLDEVGPTLEVPPVALAEVDTEPPALKVSPTLEVGAVPPLVRRGRDRGPVEDSQLKEPTAADHARRRRRANQTVLGGLLFSWAQLRLPFRIALGAGALALVTSMSVFAWRQLEPAAPRVLPPEPTELVNQGEMIEYSFGFGGVDYERADLKSFTFKAVAPTALVGILHYEARDIGKNEVAISLNGADLGFVPPDGVTDETRQLEVLLPASSVKKNQQNQLVFDNVNNPPRRDSWAVWNLWLQLYALPEAGSDQAVVEAKEQLDRAQKLYDRRDIVPDALFKAWKSYRDAWLMLEGMPGRPSDLYTIARSQQAEIWRQLDARCRTMQINYQRALKAQVPDRKRARVVMKDMLRYFPSAEHPCNLLVQGELDRLEP